jgi:glycosyltransferase involved in cell wall biosynthesis
MGSRFYPTVSVVIPTYNRAALIARSIHSVLNQSYSDFEVLVIDDGSTDDTAAVVASFRDPRIHYSRLAKNAGVGAARNIGIGMSKGKFIAFQDSDDEWLSEKLAKHMSVFEQRSPHLGVVYSDMQRILKDGSAEYHASPAVIPGRLVNPVNRRYQVWMLGIQSTVMKRECLDEAGYFNEALPALEDLELFIRLSKKFDFYRIPEPLVRYYETDGLSKDRHATLAARKLLVKLYHKELLVHDAGFLLEECLRICRTHLKLVVKQCLGSNLSAAPNHKKAAS